MDSGRMPHFFSATDSLSFLDRSFLSEIFAALQGNSIAINIAKRPKQYHDQGLFIFPDEHACRINRSFPVRLDRHYKLNADYSFGASALILNLLFSILFSNQSIIFFLGNFFFG